MSERFTMQEPCLCGDPYCQLCFPRYDDPDQDIDHDSLNKAESLSGDDLMNTIIDIATLANNPQLKL